MILEENLAFFWCLALFQEETVKFNKYVPICEWAARWSKVTTFRQLSQKISQVAIFVLYLKTHCHYYS